MFYLSLKSQSMKKFVLTILILAVSISSFSADIIDSFMVDGVYRNYILHLPTSYNASNQYPLVFNLHGYTSQASEQQIYSQMDTCADANNFIVVYPNGIGKYWNAFGSGADDVKFIDSLLERIAASYSVDRTAIYSCGMSNGGFMSYTLACQLSHKIAAIASVTGSMSSWNLANCPLSRKVPVMQIHGTADPTVDYNNGVSGWGSVGIEASLLFWRDTNNCPSVSDTLPVPNTNLADGCTAELIRFQNCGQGSEVYFYKVFGGGHTWPGAPINIGVTNKDFSATAEIWNFFKRHKLNTATGVRTVENEKSADIYPNPFSDKLTLNFENVESVSVFNLLGEIIYTGQSIEINTAEWQSGVYFVKVKTQKGSFSQKVIKSN
jgi:polyhydroxybutyrate depolymerase